MSGRDDDEMQTLSIKPTKLIIVKVKRKPEKLPIQTT